MGLDISLTGTGLALIEGPEAKDISRAEVITTSKQTGSKEARIDLVSDRICAAVISMQPELVAIEGYSFGARGDALLTLAELGGVVRYRLRHTRAQLGLQPPHYIEVAPGQWRKGLFGKGNL